MNSAQFNICIICEGYEEFDYITKLKEKRVFQDQYLLKLINAKGITKIFTRYIEKYQSSSHNLVLIFCDTDKEKQEAFWNLLDNINSFHDANVANDIVIFSRPCTMQIFLSHFAKVELKKPSKTVNNGIIKELTGIKEYDATDDERNEFMSKIKRGNYEAMKENLKDISKNNSDIPSTNFLTLIENLENPNPSWIDNINRKL